MDRPQTEESFFEFGPYLLDGAKRRLLRAGEEVALTPKEFETLLVLARRRGELVGRDELLDAVWADTNVEPGNLSVHVSSLRKKLGEAGDGQEYIQTVPRRGYRFGVSVREVEDFDLVVRKRTRTHVITREVLETNEPGGDGETQATAAGRSRGTARRFAPTAAIAAALVLIVTIGVLTFRVMSRGGDDAGRPASPVAAAPVRTLAVLPFVVEGGDAEDEYLGLGMADALITRLGNLRQIAARPTSAVRRFDAPGRDTAAIGRQLGVEAVLEGGIRKSGDRVRVTARLVRAEDGAQLWAGAFEEPFTNVFAVQDAVSQNIAGALALKLNGEEQLRLARHGTDNVEAFREYLRGRHALEKRAYDDFQQAIARFKHAIDLDPTYALAYVGLAESYLLLGDYAYAPPKETFPLARAAALRALEIDDTLAEAHATLAYAKRLYDWDVEGAERDFRRAIELNPNLAAARHRYGWHLIRQGRFDEALGEIRRAEQLDPLSPIIKSNVGVFLYFARDYDAAIAQLRRVVATDPEFLQGRRKLAWAYEAKGMGREAVAEWLRVEEMLKLPPDKMARLRAACEAEGLPGYWRVAAELDRQNREQYYVPADFPASYYARLGDRDRAFEWLERAFEERSVGLTLLKVSPVYDNLRADPRYEQLLRRLNL